MSQKITDEEIHEYLKNHWYHDEEWTDFNLAIDEGYTEYAAYLIKSAGAIDSSACCDWTKPIERAIEKMLEGYDEAAHRDELLAICKVWVRPDDNIHAFITPNHMQSDADMRSYGYVPIEEIK